MYYITTKLPRMYSQVTLEQFLFDPELKTSVRNYNEDATRTRCVSEISEADKGKVNINYLRSKLEWFNNVHESLFNVEREKLYRTFYIPKKGKVKRGSSRFRKIDQPNDELMNALRVLKTIFENDFGALYHTNAYAYIKKRCNVRAVERHQANHSRWFASFDLSNFFGSTTPEYLIGMLEKIYPFCEVMKDERGKAALIKALDLAFLNGGLPQGTPLSPMLTNLMMIPIDYELTKTLGNYNKQHFIYTRYADDFDISSEYDFDYKCIEKLVTDTLLKFGAPFKLNTEKTHYGSSSGHNFMLGICLNDQNKITVGYKKKKEFQTMVSNYVMDYKNGIRWNKQDVQVLDGLRNYYKMVEHETIDNILNHLSEKFGVNIPELIKSDLKSAG